MEYCTKCEKNHKVQHTHVESAHTPHLVSKCDCSCHLSKS